MPSYTAPIKDLPIDCHDVLETVTAFLTPAMTKLEADFTSAITRKKRPSLTSEVLAPRNAVGDREGWPFWS